MTAADWGLLGSYRHANVPSATWQDLLLVTCDLEITDLTASLMAGAVSGVRRVSCDDVKLGGNQKE